jgi:hypothetical protein
MTNQSDQEKKIEDKSEVKAMCYVDKIAFNEIGNRVHGGYDFSYTDFKEGYQLGSKEQRADFLKEVVEHIKITIDSDVALNILRLNPLGISWFLREEIKKKFGTHENTF